MGIDSAVRGAGGAGGDAGGGALRRMVRRAPPARKPPSDAGGLRQATPRVVDRVAGLAVSLGEHRFDTLSRDDLGASLPGGALVFRLVPRGPQATPSSPAAEPGLDGLAWLDADLFAALVERRLTGRVRPTVADPRPPTPLDAVICCEVIDALCEAPGVAEGAAMRTVGHLVDPDLAVVLPDLPFRVARVAVRLLQAGERGGEIGLALPDPPPPEEVPAPAGLLRPDLLGCRMELSASLPPVAVPWERITRLVPGERIDLPPDALESVRVEAIGGAAVAGGRLGRMGDARAIRLRLPSEGAAPAPSGAGMLERLAPEIEADEAPAL